MGAKMSFDTNLLKSLVNDCLSELTFKDLKSLKLDEEHLKEQLYYLYKRIDIEDFITRFQYENLPEDLKMTGEDIERLLYFNPNLAVGKVNNRLLLLPYVGIKSLNELNQWNYCKLIPFNSSSKDGKKYDNTILADFLGDKIFKIIRTETDLKNSKEEELKAVLLHDSVYLTDPNWEDNRAMLNDPLINLLSIFLPYLRTNLKLSTGVKFVGVNDDDEVIDVIQGCKSIDDFTLKGLPLIPVKRKSDFQEISNQKIANVQDYMSAMQSVNNLRQNALGLENGGLFEKEERETIAEQATNASNSSSRLKLSLRIRKNWVNLINKTFNYNIKVKINDDLTEKKEDKSKENAGLNNGQYSNENKKEEKIL